MKVSFVDFGEGIEWDEGKWYESEMGQWPKQVSKIEKYLSLKSHMDFIYCTTLIFLNINK